MLKNIPGVLSPDLLKILMEMGHGDEIVIADGNCASAALAKRLVRLDGHNVVPVLDAILTLMPLDAYVEEPVTLMSLVEGDTQIPAIWDEFKNTIKAHEEDIGIDFVERFDFYDRMRNAYAVIATGETAIYANIILKKGII